MSLGGARELYTLAADFGRASTRLASSLHDVYEQAGEDFAKDWAANARQTVGSHGPHYPDSIDSETRFALGIEVEIGPNTNKRQGGMSFELGSQNQPPHLDGARAMPAAEVRLERAADLAIGFLLP